MDIIAKISGYWQLLLAHKFVFTFIIILIFSITRRLILSFIRGDDPFLSENQRKWMSITKNSTFVCLIILLFILWESEINEFALSVTAIAIAIVVASKEIILCITGSIQRASSRSFSIGDWIEVGSLCGEVIEHNLIATVLQEIDLEHGQYDFTGKTATLPNSMFFSLPVKNLNFMKRYVFHNFSIVVKDFVNLYPMLDQLLPKLEDHFSYFADVARRYNTMIERHAGVDLPSSEIHAHIKSGSIGEQHVHFRIFCPTDKAVELESAIRNDFMIEFERFFPFEEKEKTLKSPS